MKQPTALAQQRRIVIHPYSPLDRPVIDRIPQRPVDEDGVNSLLAAAAGHRLEAVFVLAITARDATGGNLRVARPGRSPFVIPWKKPRGRSN